MIRLMGTDAAVDKIQEEAQELALALHQLKCPTKTDKKKRLNDVYGELADMKIMMRQAEMLFSKKKINRLVNQKLQLKRDKYLTNEKVNK
jgi:phosphoribosyl-ATP pyrophosphohydrolase